jgi:hypothetical protein
MVATARDGDEAEEREQRERQQREGSRGARLEPRQPTAGLGGVVARRLLLSAFVDAS